MFRIYKNILTEAFLALTFLRNRGWSDRDIRNELSTWATTQHPNETVETTGEKTLVAVILNGTDDGLLPANLTTTQSTITKVIASYLESRYNQDVHDLSLIDVLVKVLKSSYSANLLSGVKVKQLLEALLLPNELQKIITKVRAMELSCVECGRKLHHGEMVTLSTGADLLPRVICYRCKSPTVVGCDICEEVSPIDDGLRKKIIRRRHYCAKHEKPESRNQDNAEVEKEVVDLAGGFANPVPAVDNGGGVLYRATIPARRPATPMMTANQARTFIDAALRGAPDEYLVQPPTPPRPTNRPATGRWLDNLPPLDVIDEGE